MQIRQPRRYDVKGLLFAATIGIAGVAHATPLDPTSFASLGTLNVASGSITINTDTLAITGAATFNGASFSQGGSNPQIAVFTFGSFNVGAGVTINVTGSRPLALLSQGSMSIASAISLNGGNGGVPTAGAAGAAGGYVGGTGGFTGSAGGGPGGGGGSGVGHDAGGGGYGGAGGDGADNATPGISYGDLLTLLQGGSGGGGAGNVVDGNAGGGGGGGGAIELGAVGSLSLTSSLASNGGSGAAGIEHGGAGAGGGILLHAGTIAFTSLAATGGIPPTFGGAGGGGRIALAGGNLTAAQIASQIASLATSVNARTVFGPGQAGKAGVLTFRPDLATVQSAQSLNVGITSGQTGPTDPRIETLPKSLTIQSVGSATLVSPITWASGGVVSLAGGTLNINNSSTFSSGSTFNFSAGSLIVGNGQTLAVDGGVASVTMSAGLSDGATLRITNGGQLTSSSNFDIGSSGVAGAGPTGTLVVDGLNSSIICGGLPFTGWAPKDGDAATVTFSNQSSGTFGFGLRIAVGNSTALVNLNSGATLNTASIQVGNGSPGSTATININGGALNVYGGPTELKHGVVVNYSAGTFVNSGMLMLENDSQILLSTGGDKVLRANGLSIASTSKIDLADNDMIVQGGSASRTTVRNALIIGRNGGAWTGNGITSSSVAADPSHKSLGYALASDLFGPGGGTFDGIPVAGTAVLVKYTFLGDANLDGIVNALDFNTLATNFGALTNKFWNQGDFNYDGVTNTQDFTLLASNFGQAMSAPALGALVPEPMSPLVLISFIALRRRNHPRSARLS